MSEAPSRLRVPTWASLVLIGLGLAVLIVICWIYFLRTPGSDLIDGYWAKPEPWSSAGLVLGIAGASATVLLATVATLLRADIVRVLLLLPPIGLALAWWAAALGILRYPGLRHADPLRFAHAEPVVAAFALLLPAVAVAVVALSADPDRPRRVRLRPVHDQRDRTEPPES
jgi:hypothetical protein